MAGKFGGYDEDEEDVLAPKEPQVTSEEPEERKAARALRIKRRQEAIKRAEQPPEEAVLDEEPGPIEQATAAAAEELQRLALDGAAKVTNVKVTTDEREVVRRAIFTEKMSKSIQKMEEEAIQAQIQYEAISSNWDLMLSIKDPLDIDAAMKEQKQKCDELLAQKDEFIKELKMDLKRMDQSYYDDLEKQDNDIKELSDRIEKQVSLMQRAYEKQLNVIECAINMEREATVEHNNKRWEALYRQRDREEVAHMEYKFEQLEEHKQEVENIMWEHHARYREAKIELESLIQELQKELEKLKATCIINTEKIGYNYQVLKKREEENIFVRSEQKRKLNKMSDVANNLRSKIRKAAEDGAIEEIKADTEIVKLMEAMHDIEKKCGHFSHVNNYKFSQVWRMSAAKCSELCREVRHAEVALHAHMLSEPPPPPPPPPPKSPLSKYEHEEAAKSAQISPVVSNTSIASKNTIAEEAKTKLVRHILQLVADNTGFLIEDRLLKLIERYQLTARNLCTLDAIFMALEIQSEEDIELLCKTFLNYAFCPLCVANDATDNVDNIEVTTSSMEASQDDQQQDRPRAERIAIRPRPSVARSLSASTSRSAAHVAFRSQTPMLSLSDQLLVSEADEIIQKCGDVQAAGSTSAGPQSEAGSTTRRAGARGVTVSSQPTVAPAKTTKPILCPLGHQLEIEPMQVLTALNDFITVFVSPEKRRLYDILDGLKPPDFTTPSRRVTADEMEQYWAQWRNMFTTDKDRFWDGILAGLNNYLPLLQERDRLHDEVSEVRRQNAALRALIRGALPELPAAQPAYARPAPPAFTAAAPDDAHTLPPI